MSVEKENFFCCWSCWIFARGVFPLSLFFFSTHRYSLSVDSDTIQHSKAS